MKEEDEIKLDNSTVNENNYDTESSSQSETNKNFFDIPFSDLPHNIQEDLKLNGKFYLIFVNPKSGSQEGKNILYLSSRYKYDYISNYNLLTFPISITKNSQNKLNNNINTNISLLKTRFTILVFDILISKEYEKGKNFIKSYLNFFINNQLKILIAGGDGSVLSIIEDLYKDNIDINRLVFGVFPVGTGNDLCHSLGYGNSIEFGKKINNLENFIYLYTRSKITKIDIWEITINFNENSSLLVSTTKGEKIIYTSGNINNNNKNNNNNDNNNNNTNNNIIITNNNKTFNKNFINYMSLGYDAVCGAEFEMKRSSNRNCNRIIYGYEAIKRYLCCKKNYTINELIDNFISYENNNNNNIIDNKNDSSINIIRVNSNKQILYEKEENKEELNEELMNNNENIISTENIIDTNENNFDNKNNNILKGNKKIIFNNNTEKSSIKGNPIVLIAQNINYYMGGTQNIWNKSNAKDNKFSEQLFDDKKLEFFSYKNGFEMALERVFTGFANRIFQGEGPIILNFRENRDFYINIDGEFYHLINPKNLMITQSRKFNNGQINIFKYENGL